MCRDELILKTTLLPILQQYHEIFLLPKMHAKSRSPTIHVFACCSRPGTIPAEFGRLGDLASLTLNVNNLRAR